MKQKIKTLAIKKSDMNKLFFTLIITAVFSHTSFSQHRSIMWEQFNLANTGLKNIGLVTTRPANEVKQSNWSIGCETLDRDFATFDNYKKYVGELGAHHARIQSGWAKCEQIKGKYEFTWLDKIVDGLLEMKVQPWMVLCYGNPLYGANENLGARIFTDEATMTGWLAYVRATVKRYKGKVKEWEIWNEPNLGDNASFAASYANILMKTVKVVKEEQPDAVIIGFALAGTPHNFAREVFETLKKNKQETIVDYLSFHPYVHNPDEANADIDSLWKLARSYDPKIKLYQGENGCPSILEWGHALHSYPWTEISQAKWLLRRMANDWHRQIRSSIFTLVDLQYKNMLQSFGLIRTNLLHQNIYKRPSFYAVQHMINILDQDAEQTGYLQYESLAQRTISISGVKKGKYNGGLIWFSDKIPGDDLQWDKIDITIKDLSIANPVYVDIITGKVYELPKHNVKKIGNDLRLRDLPVWDSPMLLIDKSALNFKPLSAETDHLSETQGIL